MRAREHIRADWIDTILLVIFLLGIYLGYSPKVAAGIPVPCAPAGVAGLLMLLRQGPRVEERQMIALAGVIALYLISILCVPETTFLGERFKGFLQLSYSLVIAYGAWLTVTLYDRARLARILMTFCVAMLVGSALEKYTGFAAVSDAVRGMLFDSFLYDAALRDEALYGSVRPKLFTSEPSNLSFAFTAFSFLWYVVANRSGKIIVFAAMIGAAMFLMRSPTLVIGLILIVPYQLLLAGRGAHGPVRGMDMTVIAVVVLSAAALGTVVVAGGHVFSERLAELAAGNDPSFFYRVLGPILVAIDTIQHHPLAGAGLTGEEYIADAVFHTYLSAPSFSDAWRIDNVNEVLTNYFWLHWIYLGAIWGSLTLLALSSFLGKLHVPSMAFCWIVWAAMGHAAGAYVSPKPWAVLILSAAVSLLHYREPYPVMPTRNVMAYPRLRPR